MGFPTSTGTDKENTPELQPWLLNAAHTMTSIPKRMNDAAGLLHLEARACRGQDATANSTHGFPHDVSVAMDEAKFIPLTAMFV